MNTINFYKSLNDNNIHTILTGNFELVDDEMIKWFYDGLADDYDNINEHLLSIYESDLETIEDFIHDNEINIDFQFLKPEIDDTIITFSIVEA